MKKILSLIMTICLVVGMIPFSAYGADITPETSLEEFSEQLSEMNEQYADEPVSNRLIVKSERKIDKLDSVDIVEGYDDLHIVQFDNSESAEQALEHYNDSKYVEYAEEDMTISISETETSYNTTYDNHLSWGSSAIGVDDYFDYLGSIAELPEVIVGIVDTGVDLDHEFLKDRIIETGVNYSGTGTTNSENDDNGHGTHVAGIVVDNTPENVKIKAFKCMNDKGSGNISDVCLAVNTAVESNVDVINMSLGSRGTSELMEDTINNAIEKGITVCVAAGNNGQNAMNYTPANIENCITVGAINEEDQKPLWSNYGDVVDIWAPGSAIYSTYNDGGYKSLSGTSMATPFVAATSALLLSNDKSLKPNDVKDLIKNNSRLLEDTFLDYELYALYIGVLSDYKGERTAKPEFSIHGGIYLENITVEITCPDEDAEIYYSTNGKRASQDNGTLYTEPITIDKVTTLNACAYKNGKVKSLMTTETYNIVSTDADENFEIDSNGIITKYNGDNSYLSIPETINGITVNGIGNQAFRFKKIVILKMPDTLESIDFKAFSGVHGLERIIGGTLKKIGEFAFYQCENLREIDLSNTESIDSNAFLSCYSLEYCDSEKLTNIGGAAFSSCDNLMYINAPTCEMLGRQAFMGCRKAETIILPKIETIYANTFDNCSSLTELHLDNLKFIDGSNAFQFCILFDNVDFPLLKGNLPDNTFYGCYNIASINTPNITSIGNNAFKYCYRLKSIYIPSAKKIEKNVFSDCSNIENIYAPQLSSTQSLPCCDNVNIYISDKFTSSTAKATNTYNIIAPTGSYAEQWAIENGHTFISSDYRDTANDKLDNTEDVNVRAYGRSIRVTNAGLRFGFEWEEIPEIEDLASNVEYGFVYHYNYDNEPFSSNKLTVDNVGTDNVKMKK
ncbi:MAG: leucine-rich repeat protein, partial [Bacteroides sp.]|nr:leucine-rich repeat protein [Bacteroides sp.]